MWIFALRNAVAIISVETKQRRPIKRQQKSFHFTWKEKNRFLESSDSDIEKLVANAVPESTRKSTKHAVNSNLPSVI